MPRTNKARAAQGSGNIRKKTIMRNGQEYTYWEARVTVGRDPGTGKQMQRSITGKTQKAVREKMQAIAVQINDGTYTTPSKMTIGEWLDTCSNTYLTGVKPRTVEVYKSEIRLHLKPALGAIKLEALTTHTIQNFYNKLSKGTTEKVPLSPKTIKGIHGVLHAALKQAVLNGLLRANPTDACSLPRMERKEMKPLDEDDIRNFLHAVQGNRFEDLYLVTLFTGMREGEIMGLTWDCIDFERGDILINKQLQLHQETGMQAYTLVSTKSSKSRVVKAAPFVMARLRKRKKEQTMQRLKAGPLWSNPKNLVFTDELGNHLTKSVVYRTYKSLVKSIGRPEARFHDLRHSYAVAAIRSGDDIKTVQTNLGHATATFTLDVYGHVTDNMKQESAQRMENFIKSVSGE